MKKNEIINHIKVRARERKWILKSSEFRNKKDECDATTVAYDKGCYEMLKILLLELDEEEIDDE